jgi:hypothetical protein
MTSASESDFAPVAELLTDNGGISVAMDAEWIAEGIAKADAALRGEVEHDTWNRDISSVTLSRDTSVLDAYNGDTRYHQILNTADLRRVLAAWHQFILGGRNIGAELEIEIADQ